MKLSQEKYELFHGEKPSGFAHWWFKVGHAKVVFSGRFGEAVKRAKRYAKEIGETFLEVLP